MPMPTDPLLSQQWHLQNPTFGLLDLNVAPVWNPFEGPAYTGAGIRVVVIDDGFDYNHSDLAPNYNTGLDYDFNDVDLDPFGTASNAHGTAVTGIIGAAANGTGAVGVAYGVELVGYRTHNFINDFWLQNVRDAIHHAAMSAGGDVINISQGIANDLNSEFGVGYNAARFDEIETSIGTAVDSGRGGLGSIIVKSAGNSRGGAYDVNADDWSNDTRQVVVAAVDQNGFVSSYSSYGAAVLVSGFGTPGQVVTTDRTGAAGYSSGDFTTTFNGTSSAAPMVSGVVSLMLDANESLGWRDVQSILAASARHVGSAVGGGTAGSELHAWRWNAATTWNGGGMHFSNDYGYGLVDARAAVRLAETWLLTGQSAGRSSNQLTNTMDVVNSAIVIPDGNTTGLSFSGNATFDDIVDRVTVQMTFSTTFTGDVEVYLVSPDGTESIMIRDTGGGNDFNGTWTFESQAFRGERAAGTWTVRIVDDAGGDTLTVSDVVIRTWGSSTTSDRYIFTNEYSDYDGVAGHLTTISDSNGGTDTVNAAAVTTGSNIRLDGTTGSIDGVSVTFTNIENAIGGDGHDTLVGNSTDNQLHGMRGNDYLDGGNGTDALYGGTGNDTLSQNFGGPDETLDGGAGTDTADWSYSTTDSWEIDLSAGTAKLGSVTYAHLVSIENVVGGQQSDSITGNSGNNRLDGQGGNDTLAGGFNVDTLIGGTGDDLFRMVGSEFTDDVDGGSGTDTLDVSTIAFTGFTGFTINLTTGSYNNNGGLEGPRSVLGVENVIGSATTDVITGTSGDNNLDGGAGNDTLNGLGGNDTLTGGTGDDVYHVLHPGTVVINESAGGGSNDRVLARISFALAADDDIEIMSADNPATVSNLGLTGNALAQRINGNAGDNYLHDGGAGGNDTLNGLGGNDVYVINNSGAILIEGAGQGSNDRAFTTVNFTLAADDDIELLAAANAAALAGIGLTGNALAQRINGNAGDNYLHDGGAGGTDTMAGLGGNDVYVINNSGAILIEGAGQGSNDRAFTTVNFILAADDDIELLAALDAASVTGLALTGNALAQRINGNAGDNTLNDGGTGGTDTLSGLGGNDTYIINNSGTILLEGAGQGSNDRVFTNASFTLAADDDIETLAGASAAAVTPLNLTGNALAQRINGNTGANRLNGHLGNDTLSGFGGSDSFVFNTALGPTNVDRILDFQTGIDKVELENAVFTGLANGALAAAAFVANATGIATTAAQRIIYETDTGNLFFDADGTGATAAVRFAVLNTGLALTHNDFLTV